MRSNRDAEQPEQLEPVVALHALVLVPETLNLAPIEPFDHGSREQQVLALLTQRA